jgi:hypothetical protein
LRLSCLALWLSCLALCLSCLVLWLSCLVVVLSCGCLVLWLSCLVTVLSCLIFSYKQNTAQETNVCLVACLVLSPKVVIFVVWLSVMVCCCGRVSCRLSCRMSCPVFLLSSLVLVCIFQIAYLAGFECGRARGTLTINPKSTKSRFSKRSISKNL